MKQLLLIIGIVASVISSKAEVISNPIFSSTDAPDFQLKEIETKGDTTYLRFTYYAEDSSWVCISRDTYIEDIASKKHYTITNSIGIPFEPNKRITSHATQFDVTLCFPKINSRLFNLIESKTDKAFNIYGVSMTERFDSAWTYSQYLSFSELANHCIDKQDYATAIEWKEKQLHAAKTVYGYNSINYAVIMYDLCLLYGECQNTDKAIKYATQSVTLLNSIPEYEGRQEDIAREYASLMSLYSIKKDLDKASYYGEMSLKIRKDIWGEEDPYYIEFLDNLCEHYKNYGDYPKAIIHSKDIASILRKLTIKDERNIPSYIYALSKTAGLLKEMKNLQEATTYGNEAMKLIEDGKCTNPEVSFTIYNTMAAIMGEEGNTSYAITLFKKAHKSAEEAGLTNSHRMALSLLSLGRLYEHFQKDTTLAINSYSKAVDIMNIGDNAKMMGIRAEIIESLADIYRLIDPQKSHEYRTQSLNIKKEWYGEHSLKYGDVLMYYTVDTFFSLMKSKKWRVGDVEKHDVDDITNNLTLSFNIIKKHLNNSLLIVSSKDRLDYWNKYRDLFDWWINVVTFFFPTKELCSLAYDAALFSKGFMLESSNTIKECISTMDETEKGKYESYLNCIRQWEALSTSSGNREQMDSLLSDMNNYEQTLGKSILAHGYTFRKSDISWRDVQKCLKDGEVAIEFVSFEGIDRKKKQNYIIALIIDNKCNSPVITPVRMNEKQLYDIIKQSSSKKIQANAIWNEGIISCIKDAKKVYFSTSGLLNVLPVEYMPLPNDSIMMDRYDMFRLTSTGELCHNRAPLQYGGAALFGGLNYDKNRTVENEEESYPISRTLYNLVNSRGGFDYLPNTSAEIKKINSILSKKHIKCISYSDSYGTEQSFKNLPNDEINILHLATHGMYITEENAELEKDNKNLKFIASEDVDFVNEDKSLTRSFIVLSGGNALLHRENVKSSADDGILTAFEISQLAFKGLDLVVLSACQSALGDYTSEGVFGLQRGFKKAGANTILMSVDKVDDEATKILMVEFYRNLMDGKTKHQSLKDAQKYLRQVENGKYDNPEYWASFIMLDGLN